MSGRHRIVGLAAVLLGAAALAAGCGSGDGSGSSAEAAWADDLCGSLVTWRDDVNAAADTLTKGQISKESLQNAADKVSSANAKLRDDLQSLGKPPTPTATEAKDAVGQLSDDLKTNVDKIDGALSGVSGAQDVLPAVSVISGTLAAMGDAVQTTVNQLQDLQGEDKWKQAFEDSDACQKLSSR